MPPDFQKLVTRRVASLLFSASLFWGTLPCPVRAQDKPGTLLSNRAKATKPAAPKTTAPAVPTNSPALSVKDIAARAKPSLVTISFTGRDGSVEGTGSGFVVASEGLIATSLHVIG